MKKARGHRMIVHRADAIPYAAAQAEAIDCEAKQFGATDKKGLRQWR